MDWIKVLERNDIIGGDLETCEDGVFFRGPISGIAIEGNDLTITSPWCAFLGRDGWEVWQGNNPVSVAVDKCLPQVMSDGRIMFPMPFLGHGLIIPCGQSKLDPANVKGLTLA